MSESYVSDVKAIFNTRLHTKAQSICALYIHALNLLQIIKYWGHVSDLPFHASAPTTQRKLHCYMDKEEMS
jgi:hypothetical protein